MSQETPAAPAAESTPTVQETAEQLIEEVGSPAVEEELDASSEEVESEESTEQTAEERAEEIRELKKKLKLKVNGEEIEEEIDFDDDETLTKYLQKAKAFDQKAQETAEYRKQMEQLVVALQENPAAVLQEIGLNVDELAYNHLQRQVEEAQKSPEQIEREKMQARLEELEAERARMEEERTVAEQERLRDEAAAEIQEDIISTLEKHNGLLSVDDPAALGDIARTKLRYLQAGQDVPTSQIIEIVEDQYLEKLRKRAEAWDEKTFNKVFGKKKMDQLRKNRVNRKRAKTETARQIASTGETAPKEEKEAPKMSYRDFFSNHRNIK